MGADGEPFRSLSWRFPPVPTLTVTPARLRRALIICICVGLSPPVRHKTHRLRHPSASVSPNLSQATRKACEERDLGLPVFFCIAALPAYPRPVTPFGPHWQWVPAHPSGNKKTRRKGRVHVGVCRRQNYQDGEIMPPAARERNRASSGPSHFVNCSCYRAQSLPV